jgi:type II secretory pathway component PulJ
MITAVLILVIVALGTWLVLQQIMRESEAEAEAERQRFNDER